MLPDGSWGEVVMNPIYKRITCARVECAAMTYRRVNCLADLFRMPCNCGSGVLIKVVNGCETTSDNDINPRVFFKHRYKQLELEL